MSRIILGKKKKKSELIDTAYNLKAKIFLALGHKIA